MVEGFKAESFPKIELHRPSLNTTLIFPADPDIIAIATDDNINLTPSNTSLLPPKIAELSIPHLLDINSPDFIARFIMNKFLGIQND